jgi:LmbE family N-acetylglucosaminyl deacetylase
MQKNISRKKALVISPHQDDWIIGCGGLICKYNQYDWGILYFYSVTEEKEVRASEKMLGIKTRWLFNYSPRQAKFDCNMKQFAKTIRDFSPNLLVLINRDGDRDHEICHNITKETIFLAENLDEYRFGEQWEIESVIGYSVWREIQQPQLFVNIKNDMKKKIEAIHFHKSQLRSFDYELLIKSRASIYGLLSGCRYAEAYRIFKTKKII